MADTSPGQGDEKTTEDMAKQFKAISQENQSNRGYRGKSKKKNKKLKIILK